MLKKEVINNPLNININDTFGWFSQNFESKLENAFRSFWELDAKCHLLSLSEEPNFLALNKQFFVTRLKLSKRHTCVIKLSNNISKLLLDKSLGFKKKFDFDNLTDLEVKILTTFNCEIKNNINDFFHKKEYLNKLKYDENLDDKFFYLVFIVKIGNKTGNLIIIFPYEAIKLEINEEKEASLDMDLFGNNNVNVDIIVGSTKLRIGDINNLDVEDILVLENSNLENMTLKLSNNEKVDFRLTPDPTLIIDNNDDDDEYENTNENEDSKMVVNDNIWDNILVDVEARFEKVKLELGKVRRINKGEVVEIADIFQNKINLCVENKIIANGELVIINDKYGIKIDELISSPNNQTNNDVKSDDNKNKQAQSDNLNHEEEQDEDSYEKEELNDEDEQINNEGDEGNTEEDENFDYSDFDVDDDDI